MRKLLLAAAHAALCSALVPPRAAGPLRRRRLASVERLHEVWHADLSAYPAWVQQSLTAQGLDSYSQVDHSGWSWPVAAVLLGLFVSLRGGDALAGGEGSDQAAAQQLRAERRSRSGLGDAATLDDAKTDVGEWFDEDDR
ncbi:hypothetical protein M885DRAFT_588980 [Pelagophyceae sp. CCMP2097]|nr:hypothetical protein M885DRAFT_588980 [Pelagophyceae sp. CCMP2097]